MNAMQVCVLLTDISFLGMFFGYCVIRLDGDWIDVEGLLGREMGIVSENGVENSEGG
jgi:hypothetical protein